MKEERRQTYNHRSQSHNTWFHMLSRVLYQCTLVHKSPPFLLLKYTEAVEAAAVYHRERKWKNKNRGGLACFCVLLWPNMESRNGGGLGVRLVTLKLFEMCWPLIYVIDCWLFGVLTLCRIFGASLSEPHTSVTALHMCMCMFACLLACGHLS